MASAPSVAASVQLTEDDLHELYIWVDEMPLSRPKRNIARDFSDGVCVAEIVKFYFPKLVELHNYVSSSNRKQKLDNWKTLNLRVFRKLLFIVPEEEMSDIADAVPGAIERFLRALRTKISQVKARSEELLLQQEQQQQHQNHQHRNGFGPSHDMNSNAATPLSSYPATARSGRPEHPHTHSHSQQQQQQLRPASNSQPQHRNMDSVRGGNRAGSAVYNTNMHQSSKSRSPREFDEKNNINTNNNNDGVLRELLSEKDRIIFELRETVSLLSEKVGKLEELVKVKEANIETYKRRLDAKD